MPTRIKYCTRVYIYLGAQRHYCRSFDVSAETRFHADSTCANSVLVPPMAIRKVNLPLSICRSQQHKHEEREDDGRTNCSLVVEARPHKPTS